MKFLALVKGLIPETFYRELTAMDPIFLDYNATPTSSSHPPTPATINESTATTTPQQPTS